VRQKSTGFDFKQFRVEHDRCAMKVGTDAVLLGAWVDVTKASRILDVGTGSGIIALMLAQRTPASTSIDALEPDDEACAQAQQNVQQSPWQNKITLHQKTLQQFHADTRYDLIVSNPPYFSNSYLPSAINRKRARHSDTLSHMELVEQSLDLLHPYGRMAVILPYAEGEIFLARALTGKLFCNRKLAVFTRKEKKQERWIFELSFFHRETAEETLYIHENAGNHWSESYKQLTQDFYLYL
jgi:tRNA1Val (adenine37-N6)-methyltransferase